MEEIGESDMTVVICRLGNDSRLAADALRERKGALADGHKIVDLIGGLRSWSKEVDHNFPIY